MKKNFEIDPDVIRTRNLLIWSQTRYRCATESQLMKGHFIHLPTIQEECTVYAWGRMLSAFLSYLPIYTCIPHYLAGTFSMQYEILDI